MLDDADQIWNRACDPFAEHSHAGDRALQALLLVHGQVMNGGLESALAYKAPDEIERAVAGFRYFGLDAAADTLAQAVKTAFANDRIADQDAREDHLDALGQHVHDRLEQAEDDYSTAIPRDDVLEAAFRERLRAAPGDFAPLG